MAYFSQTVFGSGANGSGIFQGLICMALLILIAAMTFSAGCTAEDTNKEYFTDSVNGAQFPVWSKYPSVSGDGRFVAFVTGGENPSFPLMQTAADIKIRDMETGGIISIKNHSGLPLEYNYFISPSLSGDGRYCAFEAAVSVDKSDYYSGAEAMHGIFVFDRETNTTECISESSDKKSANGRFIDPFISEDGRYVTFSSSASNLVDGDTNENMDVFLHDVAAGKTTRISPGDGYSCPSSVSENGRYVVFASEDSSLVKGDTNGQSDIFVYDCLNGNYTCASVSSKGVLGNAASVSPDISADGRFVSFRSYASNLAGGDDNGVYDVFVHDMAGGETLIAGNKSGDIYESGWSRSPPISGDGRYVAFESAAASLTEGDDNGMEDVFVFDAEAEKTVLISVSSGGMPGNGNSNSPDISAKGRYVVFVSEASNLVQGDANGCADVFIHDLKTGRTSMVSYIPASAE